MISITPAKLSKAAFELQSRMPGARLVKNAVGNLSIVVESDGRLWQHGYVDLAFGEVEIYDEPIDLGEVG